MHNLESQVLEVLSDNRLRSFLAWEEVIVSPKHFLSMKILMKALQCFHYSDTTNSKWSDSGIIVDWTNGFGQVENT